MSSEQQDWLSAASDNQGISHEHLDLLLSDSELQQRWTRYQLMGSVIRKELPEQIDNGFADRFAAALEAEETYVLQVAPELQLASLASEPQISSWHRVKSAANRPWFKTIMQGAIAASVALVAVIGVQQHQQHPDDAFTAPLPVLQTRPIGGVATPVSLSQSSVDSRFAAQEKQLQLEQQRRLLELMQARQQQIRLLEQTAQQSLKAAPESEVKKPATGN